MKRRLFLQGLGSGVAGLGLLACNNATPGPGTGTGSGPGSGPASGAAPSAAPASTTAPAPAATTAPAAANATSGPSWDTLVAAGQKEGTVTLMGPPGDQERSVLVDAFQSQYGITVDYNALPGNQITPRITTERSAGQYNWDILIAGSAGTLEDLVPIGAVDPLTPYLILPEVTNPQNWRGGALPLIGPHGEILVMTPYQRGTLFYNTNLVQGSEITSYKDLLDPKWTGNLYVDDPRRPGPGQATFIFFFLQPDLGVDFIQALAKQNLTLQPDYQQEIDLIGQGQAPLMIGAVDYLAEARIQQGAPIGIIPATQLKESTDVSSANGNVSVFNRPPHPNAATVYLNWLLTQGEQTAFAKANSFTDARADVDGTWTESWRVPQPDAIRTDGQIAIDVRQKLDPLLTQLLGAT